MRMAYEISMFTFWREMVQTAMRRGDVETARWFAIRSRKSWVELCSAAEAAAVATGGSCS